MSWYIKKMPHIFLFLLLITNLGLAHAKVNKISSSFVFEGSTVVVTGVKFNSVANPARAILIDGNAEQFGEDLELTIAPAKFKFTAPDVSSTKTLILRVTGGDVGEDDEPDDFPLVIFNLPDLTSPDPDPPDDELNVTNITTGSVIFQNTVLTGDTNGTLLWNNKKVVDNTGALLSKKLTLNGILLTTGANGALSWNSHTIVTGAGKLQAANISNGNTTLSVAGTKSILLNSGNGAVSVTLPTSGFIAGTLRCEYSFATDGGTVGSINLRNATLPANARVTRAWYEVLTALTSASGASTIAFSIPTNDANGILAPIAISDVSTPWALGVHSTIQNGLVTNISEKTTAARNIQMVLAGEALTAGKLVLYAEYVIAP